MGYGGGIHPQRFLEASIVGHTYGHPVAPRYLFPLMAAMSHVVMHVSKGGMIDLTQCH